VEFHVKKSSAYKTALFNRVSDRNFSRKMKTSIILFTLLLGFFSYSQYNMIVTQPSAPCLPAQVLFQPDVQGSFGAMQIDFEDGAGPNVYYNLDPITVSYFFAGLYYVNVQFYDNNFNLVQTSQYNLDLSSFNNYSISSNAGSNNFIGSTIDFTMTTNDSNVSVSWDFGDGNTGIGSSPSNTYNSPGIFTVTATIQSPTCGTVIKTLTINIFDANLTIDIPNNCAPAQANFTVNSNNPAVQFYSFSGGNGFFSGITPTNSSPIVYDNPGNNSVQIVLYDINQNPIASFFEEFLVNGDDYSITTNMLNNFLTLNQQTEFNWLANNTTTPAAPNSATWDFGNGSTSNNVSPIYAYPNTGTYNVQAQYLQSCGTMATESITVTVADVDIAFTPTSNCAPTTMSFDFVGTNDAVLYNWLIQDIFGTIVYQSNNTTDDTLNYTFINPQTYFVVVQAFDASSSFIGAKAVQVDIQSPSTSTTQISTCDSQYTWTDGNTYSADGTYTQLLTNAAGCDSTATLELVLLPPDQTTESRVACSSFLWPENGQTYTASGNYAVVYSNQLGCDSTIILDLIIEQPNTANLSIVACEEHTENGVTYTQSGVYTQNLTNVAGCDSTLILDITINDPNNLNSVVTACSQFTWNGTTFNSSGTYLFEETVGCIGIYTLDLTILDPYNDTLQETACDQFTWNGVTYTTSGTYSFVGTTAEGCDSIVVLDLTINETPIAEISVNNDFELTATAGDLYQWLDCDNGYAAIPNETSQLFLAPNGNYAVEVITNGCLDTSACVLVENSTASIIENDFAQIKMYPNPASTELVLSNLPENSAIRLVNMQGKVVISSQAKESKYRIGVEDLPSGIYFVMIKANQNIEVQKLVVKK
jgi:hypothetical protein